MENDFENRLFAEILNLGSLFYYHVYLCFNGPQIFSYITPESKLYLFMSLIDDLVDDCWLVLPVSEELLSLMEANLCNLRDSFCDCRFEKFKVKRIGNIFIVDKMFSLESIIYELPEKDFYLDYEVRGKLTPLGMGEVANLDRNI